jgi:hypothetical protein
MPDLASGQDIIWDGSVTVTADAPAQGSGTFTGTAQLPYNGGQVTLSNNLGTLTLTTTATTAGVALSNLHDIFEATDGTTIDCHACTGSSCASPTVPITQQLTRLHFQGSYSAGAQCLVTFPDKTTTVINNGFGISFQGSAYFASGAPAVAGSNLTIHHNGTLVAVPSGQSILVGAGDMLTTASNGQASLTFSDGSVVALGANATLVIEDVGTSTRPTLLAQALGFLQFQVSCGLRTPPCYKIHTPNVIVSVRGTNFTSNVVQSGNIVTSTTTVSSGSVDQTDLQGRTTTVTAGSSVQASGTQPTLVASVLPASRSVVTTEAATAFAAIINAGSSDALSCRLSAPQSPPTVFTYQQTDASNTPVGNQNMPVDIPAGGVQTFVFAITPTAPFSPTDVQLVYTCNNSNTVTPLIGINTLLLSATDTAVPDVIAVGLTPSNDGFAHTGGKGGTGLFVIASDNIGLSASLTARARLSNPSLPITATVCQTDPHTAACLATPAASVTATINNAQTSTWAAFLTASGAVNPDPAANRVFFEFVDSGGIVRGSTSTAITTQ